jgi:rhodanese-related sulfurtransferase
MDVELFEKMKRRGILRRSKIFFENLTDFTRGPIELDKMIKEGDILNIIDVRSPEDYAKEHIRGAINLPEENWSTFKGLSKDRPNVVYCHSVVCQLSARAARYFAEHDFPVIQLIGGIEQWKNHSLPLETSEKRV